MTESIDLDRMAEEVRKAAEECGAMVLKSILGSEHLAAVAVDGDTFPSLIKHIRPRLIYKVLVEFDATDEVAAHFEEEEPDSDLRKLATKWKPKNGQSARLILGLMADGVLHGTVETADWYGDFEDEAEELEEARADEFRATFEREQEAEDARRETEEKKRWAPYVKKLTADERFNGPKISAAKRTTLAEALFPELDRTSLKKVVDRATNQQWLGEK
ncbi:hypothetical protein [Rhizobium ruizarguesonis]|uniref:hypothetical protein n=1 Tax=Rhizobium ruizarguesonis TaxID=2081791 RepID=UPI00102F95F3|nr:hypothetical protein [Rhizobium ruizarguesonis]TAT70061.1 hypothetical protein ELI52_38205 [Rhizobium ruizarguesonis]